MPDLKLKSIKIDFQTGTVRSKTSNKLDSNLVTFDAASRSAYGIVHHNDQFIFGVTQYIYHGELDSTAGYLMNTERQRLTKTYENAYQIDSDFTELPGQDTVGAALSSETIDIRTEDADPFDFSENVKSD